MTQFKHLFYMVCIPYLQWLGDVLGTCLVGCNRFNDQLRYLRLCAQLQPLGLDFLNVHGHE